MRYVQTSNGVFVRHIRDEFESIRWDETHKTSVRKLTTEDRLRFGIERLQLVTPPYFDPSTQTRTEEAALLEGNTWTQTWAVTSLVGEALAEASAKADKEAAELSKKTGIEILGVLCSATKDDQMGLTAVGLDYSMTNGAGEAFANTKFEFANGNTLVINSDNFATIYNAWVPFRRSFFVPD